MTGSHFRRLRGRGLWRGGFVFLFVWLNKTRIVNPQERFHPWRLATQDGPAFSKKTARRHSKSNYGKQSTSWRAGSPHRITQAQHKTYPFCLNLMNRLGENCLQSFLIIGCMCRDGPVFTTRCWNSDRTTNFGVSIKILWLHFTFWCIPPHVFMCSFDLCGKVDRKKTPPHELKFRPYHKCWFFNEKLPMIFHFLDSLSDYIENK